MAAVLDTFPRLVLVDDDDDLRDEIAYALRERGFPVVEECRSASELYVALLSHEVDIVLLDLGLPDSDGMEVARRLRAVSPVGIVMFTGRGESAARIEGLGAGADAYLVKPVDFSEMAATLMSLHRRMGLRRGSVEARASSRWSLTDDAWTLCAPDGERVGLTAAERSALLCLASPPGQLRDREALIACLTDNAWDYDPHRLDMLIHRLRTKVSRQAGQELPLRTVRGVGYMLAPSDFETCA